MITKKNANMIILKNTNMKIKFLKKIIKTKNIVKQKIYPSF